MNISDDAVEAADTHYWACSGCDSGGHPLSVTTSAEYAQGHLEQTGHVVIRGRIEGTV
jgi:hypothetical protein